MNSRGLRIGILLGVSLLIAACEPASFQIQEVDIQNATGVPIVLWSAGRGSAGGRSKLEVGQTKNNAWLGPPPGPMREQPMYRVDADDLSGEPIYCRVFSYQELEAQRWRITIRYGENVC